MALTLQIKSSRVTNSRIKVAWAFLFQRIFVYVCLKTTPHHVLMHCLDPWLGSSRVRWQIRKEPLACSSLVSSYPVRWKVGSKPATRRSGHAAYSSSLEKWTLSLPERKILQDAGKVPYNKLIITFQSHGFCRSRNLTCSPGTCLAIGGLLTVTIKDTRLCAPTTQVVKSSTKRSENQNQNKF